MNNLVDEIVFMIFDNNIINNPNDIETFLNKLIVKLKINNYDSIDIENTDDEYESDENPETSDDEFINDESESDDEEDVSELVDEELKIIVKNDFCEIK
jgi:hypothetical protein